MFCHKPQRLFSFVRGYPSKGGVYRGQNSLPQASTVVFVREGLPKIMLDPSEWNAA